MILMGIVAVGAMLRFLYLGKESLWLDELASWDFSSSFSKALHAEATNPPLYYLLLHAWSAVWGTSEAGLRSLSAIPGIVSIWLVWRLGSLLISERVGLAAAAYFAVSSFQIFYSQEARTFSWLVFWVLCGSLTLWKALHEDSTVKWRYYGLYALCMSLGVYSHFIAIFFIGGQGLFVLLAQRRRLIPYLTSVAAIIVMFSPWLLALLKGASNGGGQSRRYLFLKLPQAYFSFLFGDTLIPLDENAVTHIRETLLRYSPQLIGAVLCIAVLAVFALRGWRLRGEGALYAATMGIAPVLAAWLVSFKVMLFDERYLIPASPFLYILAGVAIQEIWRERAAPRWMKAVGITSVLILGMLLGESLFNYYFNGRFGKEQWREAIALLESRSQPGDLLVFDPDYIDGGYLYYRHKEELPYWKVPDAHVEEETKPARIEEKTAGHQRLWLVRAHYSDDTVLNALQSRFAEAADYTFPRAKGIELMLMERKTGGTP